MIMKKFYISILAGAFLLISYISQGQVYSSITSNPTSLTFDDPAFWQGGIAPPNPCNGCTIQINANVSMVQAGNSSTLGTNIFTVQTPDPGGADIANFGPGWTLGTRFVTTVDGFITGIRFFKAPGAGSGHIGALWQESIPGAPLATVNFVGETASGWQTANFASPVPITATTTYVTAYYSPDGIFERTTPFFTAPVTNGPLTALQDFPANRNGEYWNGLGLTYPSLPPVPTAVNYWADVNYVAVTNLNDMVFNGCTFTVSGTTTFNINTYVELTGPSKFVIASDPADHVTVNLNDQMDLGPSAIVQIGNGNSFINTNNVGGNTIIGPHVDFTDAPNKVAGIYSILVVPFNTYSNSPYSYVLTPSAIGIDPLGPPPPTVQQPSYLASDGGLFVPVNCGGAGGCNPGFISGPSVTYQSGTSGPGNFYGVIFKSSPVSLPVELVQFLASKKDDGSVLLSWATSQEVNAGYFDVERSSDQSGWLKLGSVKAKGNSSTTSNYNFSDKLPLDGPGYYRLKMVDLDGKFKYSKVVSVTGDKNTQALVIYNNPFSDMIRLKVNVSRAQNLVLSVSDMLGKTIINKSYQAGAGDNFVNLQPGTGGSGMYILHIHGNSYDQTVKLQKQ
jgi:hypothetical protein